MTRRNRRSIVLGAVVIIILLVCSGLIFPAVDLAGNLICGWWFFIVRVFPKVQVRWDLIFWAIIYIVAFLLGSHSFLRWLYRETEGGVWKWRWTFGGFVVVILMFLSGMASIGITHQVGWLATSPKPIIHMSRTMREAATRVVCASNLRQIAGAIDSYCKENSGRFPEDFRVLLLKYDLSPQCLLCPDADDDGNPRYLSSVLTPQQAADELLQSGHCSYIYFGRGLTAPAADNQVIATEPLSNHHGDGANVLFGDGHVEYEQQLQLSRLLRSMTAPSTQP